MHLINEVEHSKQNLVSGTVGISIFSNASGELLVDAMVLTTDD